MTAGLAQALRFDVFDRAAELVERGWTQGASAKRGSVRVSFDHDFATCFCAAGAIARAAKEQHGNDAWHRVYSEALTIANKQVRTLNPKLHLMSWNDAAERTQAQVVALLRECATSATEEPRR